MYDIIKTGPILQSLIVKLEERRIGHKFLRESDFDSSVKNGLEMENVEVSKIISYINDWATVIISNKVADSMPFLDENFYFSIENHIQGDPLVTYSKSIYRSIFT